MKNAIRFLGTVWGWLVMAAMIGGLSLLVIAAQDQYRSDLDLRVWHGD